MTVMAASQVEASIGRRAGCFEELAPGAASVDV